MTKYVCIFLYQAPLSKTFCWKKNQSWIKMFMYWLYFISKIQSKVNIHVCLPYLSNKILNFLSQSSYQQNNGYPCFDLKLEDNSWKKSSVFQTALKMPLSKYCDFHSYLFQSSLVGLHALNQRNSKWIELVSLVSFVDNSQGNSESEPSQIPYLHVQQSLIKSQ